MNPHSHSEDRSHNHCTLTVTITLISVVGLYILPFHVLVNSQVTECSMLQVVSR